MYTRAIRGKIECGYQVLNSTLAGCFRWLHPNDFKKPITRVKFPGPNHLAQATSGVSASFILSFFFIAKLAICKHEEIERQLLYRH